LAFTYYGTSYSDDIDTKDLYASYPQYYNFRVYAGDGDDSLDANIYKRIGHDTLNGEGGDDNMFATALGTTFAVVGAYGGYGFDTITSVMNLGSEPTFIKNYSTIIDTTIYPIDGGSELSLGIGDSTEIIIFKVNGEWRAWLTEELFSDLSASSMSTDEAFSRATEDWAYYGFTSTPSYALSTSDSNYNEGQSLITTGSTDNVSEGTSLYWSLSGNGINAGDFSSFYNGIDWSNSSAGSLKGSSTVSSNGSFSFSYLISNDGKTEGEETLNIKLYSDSERTNQVGSTASVRINDTSLTPTLSYAL